MLNKFFKCNIIFHIWSISHSQINLKTTLDKTKNNVPNKRRKFSFFYSNFKQLADFIGVHYKNSVWTIAMMKLYIYKIFPAARHIIKIVYHSPLQ